MVDPQINRRSAARMPLRVSASVDLPDGTTRDATTLDVGPSGISVMTQRPISPGTRCTVRLELPLPDGGRAVSLPARSVHSSYTGPSAFRVGMAIGPLDADQEAVVQAFMKA